MSLGRSASPLLVLLALVADVSLARPPSRGRYNTLTIDRDIFAYNATAYGNWSEWGECHTQDNCTQIRFRECLDGSYKDRIDNYRLYSGCNVRFITERRRCVGQDLADCRQIIEQRMEKVNQLWDTCQGTMKKGKVFGGEKTEPGHWPFYASMVTDNEDRNQLFCGATLISPSHALTAAHCLSFLETSKRSRTQNMRGSWLPIKRSFGTELFLRINDHDLLEDEDNEVSVEVSAFKIHPSYASFDYDVAILKLENPVNHTAFACLPRTNNVPETDTQCFAVGMGHLGKPPRRRHPAIPFESLFDRLLEELLSDDLLSPGFAKIRRRGKNTSSTLQQVELPIRDLRECSRRFGHLNPQSQICAGVRGKDTCVGDSGAGLFCKIDSQWKLVGITSFGVKSGCGRHPSIYSSVPGTLEWIRKSLTEDF